MKKTLLSRWDFLNIPTSLSFKNDYYYATNAGAILTILFFIIIIILSLYEIILLSKKSSFTLKSNQYTDLSQVIDFSQTPFLFELTNDYGQLIDIDHKLFVIEAYNTEMEIIIFENGTTQKKFINNKLELEKCDKIFSNQSEYSELNLSRYICIKPGQNLTSFGLVGDINYPFKGIRIYINKCSGSDCYDTTEIIKKLNNAKFIVTYLSLSSNMFYLKNEKIKYQLYSKYFSLSTNVLKKITFTYDIGRFYLYNNVAFRNEISFNYILGNDYTIDFDLDPSSTIQNNKYTLATISFNYGGRIIETRKEVQTIFESISVIGNYFNLILNIFKVINRYYSDKILFIDIFTTLFSEKNNINFKNKRNINMNNRLSLNINKNVNKKNNLNLSNELLNKNQNDYNNKENSVKSIYNKFITTNVKNSMAKQSKTNDKIQGNIAKSKLIYYILFPHWILRRIKKLNYIYLIKSIICGYFSIEKMNELIRFKEIIEENSSKTQVSKTELIKIKDKKLEENCIIDLVNKNP